MALLSDKDQLPPDQSVEVWVSNIDDPKQFTKLKRWNSYNISTAVMEPASTFSLDFAGDKEQRDQIAPHGGQRVFVFSHGALQITGFTQERSDATNKGNTDNQITGRSTAGLLLDSAVPANQLNIANQTVKNLALKWLDPWMPDDIPSVVANAAANRFVMAGGYVYGTQAFPGLTTQVFNSVFFSPGKVRRRRYGKFGKDSPDFAGTTTEGLRTTRLQKGIKVWEALKQQADAIGAHVWQACDGSIIISRPTYGFDPTAYGGGLTLSWDKQSDKATGGNIEEVKLDTSIAERASEYTIISAVKSTKGVRGSSMFSTRSIKDPSPAFWDDTLTTKRLHKPDLIQATQISNPATVSRIARRTMCEKALEGISYTVLIAGHHSPSGALWVPDSMVQVDDDRNNIHAPMYISKVERRFDRQSGRTTQLDLKPPDIWLGQYDVDGIATSVFNAQMRKRIWW